MTSSVDGLVSGLSTSSVISQLMTVEAAPQTRLKSKVSTAQTAVAAYQSVNTKLLAFKAAAEDLGRLSNWRAIKATPSSTSVTATPTGDLASTSGSLTFDVKYLATKQTTTLKVDTTATSLTSSLTINPGAYADDGTFTPGTPVTIDISADQSAAGIAKAVNSANIGIKAYLVTTGSSSGVLQFSGANSGAANGFTISGLDSAGIGGTDPATTLPTDAVVQVGGTTGAGYSVSSSTNTFTGLMSGVTITVSKQENGVTVDAAADVSGIAAKFQALVDTANATLGEIGNQTAFDAGTNTSSPLTGDFMVRNMRQTILSAVSGGLTYANPAYTGPGDTTHPPTLADGSANPAYTGPADTTHAPTLDGGSLSKYGIQLNRDGQLAFNATKFTASYNTDPTGIQQAGRGLADNFVSLAAKQLTSVAAVMTGQNSEIDTINDQISNWDVRLVNKKAALQKQYAGLEVALGKLKDQSSWLSGQLAGLS